jgi:hypothetical protein
VVDLGEGGCATTFLVPRPPSSFVDGFASHLYEVERIHALAQLRGFRVGHLLVGTTHIEADGFKLGHSSGSELVVEGFENRGALALSRPDGSALVVVIGDDGEIAVTLAIGALVDPMRRSPSKRSTSSSCATTSTTILATLSQPMRSNVVIVVLSVRRASHATTEVKDVVWRALGRAQGTSSVRTRPQRGHLF